MSEIEPALSAEEWAEKRDDVAYFAFFVPGVSPGYARQAMAMANDSLPDDHPGKITHEQLAALRSTCEELDVQHGWPDGRAPGLVLALADALDALLPPREG